MIGWEMTAVLLAILTPLVGVPLTVITFYLKGLREHQVGRFSDLSQRVEVLEASVRRVGDEVAAMQRDYATKEEWLRESMWARGQIERLSVSMTRAETELDRMDALMASVERTGRLVASIGERVGANTLSGDAPDKESC